MLRGLREHQAGLSTRVLRQRLGIVGGDGAVAAGGSEAEHSSSKAAELLWATVRPDAAGTPFTEWDLLHRVDAAVSHALRSHPAIQELLDIAKVLGALLGTGDGRALYRGVQVQMGGARTRAVPDQGGNRKMVALAASIRYAAENLHAVHGSLHARLGLARDRGWIADAAPFY